MANYFETEDGKIRAYSFIQALEDNRLFAVVKGQTKVIYGTKYVGFYYVPKEGGVYNFNYLFEKCGFIRAEKDGIYLIALKGYTSDVIHRALNAVVDTIVRNGLPTGTNTRAKINNISIL